MLTYAEPISLMQIHPLPPDSGHIVFDMGLLKSGASAQASAIEGFDSSALEPIREAARGAQLAGRKSFVARLPLPSGSGVGDVPFWSAAVQQIGQFGWGLAQWTVCPEDEGPVAYAVFVR